MEIKLSRGLWTSYQKRQLCGLALVNLKPGEWGQLLPPVTLFKACLSDDLHVVWTARRWEEKAGMAVIESFEELLVIRPFGFILPRN